MNHEDTTNELDQQVRIVQNIAAALMAGPVIFGVIVIVISMGKQPGEPLVGYIAAGYTVMALVVWAIVPAKMAKSQFSRDGVKSDLGDSPDRDHLAIRLAPLFKTKTIIE